MDWDSLRGNSHFFWEGEIPGFLGISLPHPQLSPHFFRIGKNQEFSCWTQIFFQPEGICALKDSQILGWNSNSKGLGWNSSLALDTKFPFPVFFPVFFFFPRLNSLVLTFFFLNFIFQKSGNVESQKKAGSFSKIPAVLGVQLSCFSWLELLQISGKKGREKNSGILGERKIPNFQTPEISKDVWEFLIPPGWEGIPLKLI